MSRTAMRNFKGYNAEIDNIEKRYGLQKPISLYPYPKENATVILKIYIDHSSPKLSIRLLRITAHPTSRILFLNHGSYSDFVWFFINFLTKALSIGAPIIMEDDKVLSADDFASLGILLNGGFVTSDKLIISFSSGEPT